MTLRERTLAIMAHQPTDGIVYQPRIEHWYGVNKAQGTLPERYKNMSLLEVYEDLGCSIRSYAFFNGCLKSVEDPNVKSEVIQEGNRSIWRISTPVGTLETSYTFTATASHTEKFPVVNPEDMQVMEYILRGRRWEFDMAAFEENDALMGDRAEPMVFIPRVNIQRLFIDFMGVENTLYALADDPAGVERLMEVINETDTAMLEMVADSPIKLINFGDNVDQHFLPPRFLERYLLPEYIRRVEILRAAGKYTFAHWDGSVKALLSYAKATELDGIEAITPLPQGDVTIEETKEALGDMVLLDGIPMTWFLFHEKHADLEKVTRRIIETFRPNLILGISDEPSPVCDIERVRMVQEIVDEYES